MKKNMFKAMLYLVCIGLFISPLLAMATNHKKDKPGTAIFVMCDTPCIMTTTKHIFKDSPIVSLDIKVPQLHGLSDKKFEKKLNKSFLRTAQDKAEDTIKNAEDYNKLSLEQQLPALKHEYLSNYTIIETVDPYFVIEFLEYAYSGGAHGLSTQTYVTVDTLQNTIVTLQSLFKENSNYLNIINNEISRQIQERISTGEYFFTGTDGFSSIKIDQPFYINTNGDIVIVFNVYEIAPYAAGVIEFIIPQTLLASDFK